ncbi:MAG: NUDIX domain-containing protein [Acidobacteriota bacterium]|nr:NUDIX domain-containing protein [Acidobacteriota bacterium]
MAKRSAGLLLHRPGPSGVEVLLVHPGGPFWARRDEGAWTVPKGEYDEGEEPAAVAEREFAEEIGVPAPAGTRRDLGELRQRGGKWTRLWALGADLDVSEVSSNTFEMEWPPRSGTTAVFPEVDAARWVPLAEAPRMLLASLVPFLDRLEALLDEEGGPPATGR